MNTVTGAGEKKPAPFPNLIHDDKYNLEVYPATCTNAVIDILVPAHANIELTIACVKSLYTCTGTPFHLIILDDAPLDDYGLTEQYAKGLQKAQANVTYCHSNILWKTGNTFFNVGIKYSHTDYIATVMNSMTVEPDWEITALQLMKQDPLIGTIGFKCLFPNGLIESAGIKFHDFLPTDMFRDELGYRCNEIREAEAVQWAFALHRKAALVGNLEEDTFNGHVGWDDIDNCLVVRSKGWKILYCGQGVGIHKPRATRGSNSLDAFLRNQENSHRFFKRWGLWNKYLEGSKMDIANILKHETKDKLTQAVLKMQVLQSYLKDEEARVQVMVNDAMKEVGVDAQQYQLEMNPQQNIWALKVNAKSLKPASDTEPGKLENTKEAVKA